MTVFTYVGNNEIGDQTAAIKVGNVWMPIGTYADLQDGDVEEILSSGRYLLVAGIVAPATPAPLSSPYQPVFTGTNGYVGGPGGTQIDPSVLSGSGGSGGSSLAPTAVKTANYTAAASDYVPADTSGGTFAVTLPTAPTDKAQVGIKIINGSTALTVAAGGSDVFNKAGGGTTLTLSLSLQGVLLQYSHTAAIWYVLADDLPLSDLDARYVAQSGSAGGDLSGTYPNPGVAKLNGVAASGYAQITQALVTRNGQLALRDFISVMDYGATGNGSTDDTTAIQNAINHTPLGATLWFPTGQYIISSPLVFAQAITVRGSAASMWAGSTAYGSNWNFPQNAPFFSGSVVYMTTAATDAIHITVQQESVNFKDFAVVFGPPAGGGSVLLQNTGHGFNCIPPLNGANYQLGMFGAHWENVYVLGHDGSHYGYDLLNTGLCTFTHIFAFGGGGIKLDSNFTGAVGAGAGSGNNTFVHPYLVMIAGTVADVINIGATHTTEVNSFYSPQCWVTPGACGGITPTTPSNSQKFWNEVNGRNNNFDSADLETAGTNTIYGGVTTGGGYHVLPTGTAMARPGGRIATSYGVGSSGSSTNWSLELINHLITGIGSQNAAAAAGSSAGSGPPTPLIAGFTTGTCSFGTGTGPSTGAQVVITAAHGYPYTSNGTLTALVTPQNAATQALGLYVSATTLTTVTLAAANAPSASQANTTYSFSFLLTLALPA